MIQPTTQSSFVSTQWNGAGKARRATNAAMFGGPNINITEGSKIQFADGTVIWDVVRIFEDKTLFLSSMSSGIKRTRKIPPDSKSWANIRMVDGKRSSLAREEQKLRPRGGGPNRTIDPGQVITLGTSKVRWVVRSIAANGAMEVASYNGTSVVTTEISPKSKFWNSIYVVSK